MTQLRNSQTKINGNQSNSFKIGKDDSANASSLTSHIALSTQAKVRKDTVYNWSGIQPISKKNQVQFPKNAERISELLRTTMGKVHVIGSGLSYEQIMSLSMDDETGVILNMENFKGLVRMSDCSATFGASTSVNDIISILGQHDRMLPCSPGVIGIQTIAGSIATGTHGQGLFQSTYSDIVKSMRVVLPSGVITDIDENSELPLQAFIASIGMLGVILEVEIYTTERRVFHCRKSAVGYDEFLKDYEEWNRKYEYVKAWWFPETDQCHLWEVDEACPKLASKFLNTSKETPLELTDASDAMNDTVDKYMNALSHDTKSDSKSSQPQFQTVKRFADSKDLVGYSEQILCKGIPVPQINCEIAVPLDRFKEATEALHKWNETNPGRLHYPFIYRATGKSKAWMSPAFSGESVWIGFLVYVAEDGTVRSDGMETMREIQKILSSFGGLPHWGKHFAKEEFRFGSKIENWNKFFQFRKSLDPTDKMFSKTLSQVYESQLFQKRKSYQHFYAAQ
eukprot:TRINITY_DN3043_c0_g1_i1.p1 TRINITY_DN3043_c0_g1~~TRINITY_DN3043_c0_g1_i1.p1  ORF type:complete len:510 (-),score=146.88 TRINITY_DN3043_c0_g1_i1:34-1563(-)